MNLLLDLETMSVMLPGGVPVSDLNLVSGDMVPLRITVLDEGVAVAPEGVRLAMAVKVDAASDQLVLAVTDMVAVEGEYGVCYVGVLSVNTVQLAEAMGDAERMDFVGEVVLIDAGGGQRTSGLIRVRIRRDLLGGDVVPPEEVVRDWVSMAEDALRGPLDQAVADVRAAGAEGVQMAGLAEQYAVQAFNSAQRAAGLDEHALESAQRAEAAAGAAGDAVGLHAESIMSTTVAGHAKLGTAKTIGADGGMVGKSTTDQLVVVPAATGYAGAVKLAVKVTAGGCAVPVSGQVYGAIQNALGDALTSYSIAEQAMGVGTFNTEFNWCEWAGLRIEGGELTGINIPCRTNSSSSLTTSPVFLSVWQANEAGVWVHQGFSINAVTQAVNTTGHWSFSGITLAAGRAVRVCPVPDYSRGWVTGLVLGGRRAAATDGSKIELNGVNYSYAVDAAFAVKVGAVARYAEAGSLVAAIDARLRELGQVYLTLSDTEVTVPAEGGTVSIVVYTNAEGTVRHNGSAMSSNVLTVDVGANLYAYEITVQTGVIQAGSFSKEYRIVQEGGEEYFDVTPGSLSVPAEGGEFWVKVVYNTSKTPALAVDIPWAVAGPNLIEKGSTFNRPSDTHFFTAGANETGEVRTGLITVTLNGKKQTCVVTQEAE